MGLQDFLMRKMLANKMKGVPQAEQDKIFDILQKNPQLFQNIAMETQTLMKSGMDQMAAVQQVMKKYEGDLAKLKN